MKTLKDVFKYMVEEEATGIEDYHKLILVLKDKSKYPFLKLSIRNQIIKILQFSMKDEIKHRSALKEIYNYLSKMKGNLDKKEKKEVI